MPLLVVAKESIVPVVGERNLGELVAAAVLVAVSFIVVVEAVNVVVVVVVVVVVIVVVTMAVVVLGWVVGTVVVAMLGTQETFSDVRCKS